jgi:cytochrome c553
MQRVEGARALAADLDCEVRVKYRVLSLAAAAIVGAAVASFAFGAKSEKQEALSLTELMGHVFHRNARQLWAWTALENDTQGSRSGAPVNDEEWEDAESDALTLRHFAATLRDPSYRLEDPRWDRLSKDLERAATASAEAAERKDFAKLLAAGEAVNAACIACHEAFAPALEERPPPVPIS